MRSGRTVRWMGIYSCYNMMDSFVAVSVACVLGNMQDGFDNSPRELISSIPVYTFILRLSNVLLPQLPPDADLVKSLTVQCGPVFQEMCKMGLVTVERRRDFLCRNFIPFL
ncbi:hypothetical protein V1478_017215 [Vespula squamosa]|uniref:Uncharacterized protein n=2 Tax=Vespula squamosa TaxID=30214 RepID=A0ABD1ZXW1_VESSQ